MITALTRIETTTGRSGGSYVDPGCATDRAARAAKYALGLARRAHAQKVAGE